MTQFSPQYTWLTFLLFSIAMQPKDGNQSASAANPNQGEDLLDERQASEEKTDASDSQDVEHNVDVDFTQLKGTKRKYFELKLKMVMWICSFSNLSFRGC